MRWLALPVALALIASGCFGGVGTPKASLADPAADGAAGASPEAVEDAAGNLTEIVWENVTLDDAFTMTVNATPEGGLAGFWWSLPKGAIVEQAPSTNALCGVVARCGSSTLVALQISPHVPDERGQAPDAWQFTVFRARDGELFYLRTLGDEAGTFEYTAMTTPASEEQVPVLEPRNERLFHFGYGHGDPWAEGERLGLVVAARSAEPLSFTLAIRALDRDPGCCGSSAEQPPANHDAFVRELGGREPIPLPPHALGTGYHVAGYDDWGGGTDIGKWTTPDMAVQETIPLGLGPRAQSITLTSTVPFERGWSILWTYAGGTVLGGTARTTADLHGTPVSEDEAFAMAWYTGKYPDVAAVAEGPGPASAVFAVQWADPTGMDYLGMWHVAWGATVEDLLGLPLPPYLSTFDLA